MMNLFLSLSVRTLNKIKALISYKWNTVTDENNVRYLDNPAESKELNDAEMFTGRGLELDTNNGLTGLDTTGATHTIYTFNGETVYLVGVLDLVTAPTAGTYGNVIYLSVALTQAQQDKYTSQPETFLQMKDGVRYSEDIDISKVVSWIPCTMLDDKEIDLAQYSLGSEINDNASWSTQTGWDYADGLLTSIGDNINHQSYIANTLNSGESQHIKFTVDNISGILLVYKKGSVFTLIDNITSVGEYEYLIAAQEDNVEFVFYSNTFTGSISNISMRNVTGLLEISNYTTSCRDNVINLNKGLQCGKLVRDSLGMITAKSNFLEGDGVGYCDTGWIPDVNKDWSIEFIHDAKVDTYVETVGICGNSHTGTGKIRFYVGLGNRAHCWIGNQYSLIASPEDGKCHWLFSYNSIEDSYKFFLNGVLVEYQLNVGLTQDSSSFLLQDTVAVYRTSIIMPLFKVHEKALTQEEVTKAYNKILPKLIEWNNE